MRYHIGTFILNLPSSVSDSLPDPNMMIIPLLEGLVDQSTPLGVQVSSTSRTGRTALAAYDEMTVVGRPSEVVPAASWPATHPGYQCDHKDENDEGQRGSEQDDRQEWPGFLVLLMIWLGAIHHHWKRDRKECEYKVIYTNCRFLIAGKKSVIVQEKNLRYRKNQPLNSRNILPLNCTKSLLLNCRKVCTWTAKKNYLEVAENLQSMCRKQKICKLFCNLHTFYRLKF